jgi:hypothetical protein
MNGSEMFKDTAENPPKAKKGFKAYVGYNILKFHALHAHI